MNKREIIKKIMQKKMKKNLCKSESKLLLNHNEWVELTDNEIQNIKKCNIKTAKLMKNIYDGWNNTDKSYYISDLYYQRDILPKLNNINYTNYGAIMGKSYFTDKNFEEKVANIFKFPNNIVRCIDGEFYDKNFNYISINDAMDLLRKYNKAVFKRTLGDGHGKGVSIVNENEYENQIKKFGDNYVVQELIKQHNFLSNFNESSVNVIRITSVLWKGKVYILSGILRVGAPGSFCDHLGSNSTGPRIIGLDENGKLNAYCVDPDNVIKYDSIYGKKIVGKIPFYNEMKKLVCEQHSKFIHHKIIGWDLTLNDKNEIVCIEFNSNAPGIIQSQMVCGPIFSKKLDDGSVLLDEILNN